MQEATHDIVIFLVIITILIFVMISFIISLVYLYKKKQRFYFHNLELIKHDHEKNLLQSQVEVQEQTFQNISREIHDNINLSLTLAKLQLNTLNIENKEKAALLINSSVDLLSKAIKDLSDLSQSMNAEIIAQEGLIDALKNETSRISKASFLEITTEITGSPIFLDAKKELVIFRIIQETFNNIVKHAFANKVELHLHYNVEKLEIMIKDDGKGFEPERLSPKIGAGLSNMKTRSKIFNGDVDIESYPGAGTKVLILIPY